MKLKRTTALTLATIFSLTLMGQNAPKTFAKEETPEITTVQELDSKTQEKINQEVKKLDEQGKLDELKEEVKKLNEKLKKEKEDSYFSKNGISNILHHPFKILFSGATTFVIELILMLIPGVNLFVAPILSFCHLVYLLPILSMLAKSIDLYAEGCKKD